MQCLLESNCHLYTVGELTEGAIDIIRHSITKESHTHFVSTEQEYRNRVIQLGEDPNTKVFNVGEGFELD